MPVGLRHCNVSEKGDAFSHQEIIDVHPRTNKGLSIS